MCGRILQLTNAVSGGRDQPAFSIRNCGPDRNFTASVCLRCLFQGNAHVTAKRISDAVFRFRMHGNSLFRPFLPESGSVPRRHRADPAFPIQTDGVCVWRRMGTGCIHAAMSDTESDSQRVAKVMARAGVESRRGAERMIVEGRVAVNGQLISSPAFNVSDKDQISVDGRPIPRREPPRLWRHHKPAGLITSVSDEKGRSTVFDRLPPDMPRVMPVGRLDLTSEGLLLLTNDGGLKRWLEHPSTGWLRKYRVRAFGEPDDNRLAELKSGTAADGRRFGPIDVEIDSRRGANTWFTVKLRQGRNREIRRAMESVGLTVNRLIRISFGPFRLGELRPGEVQEVRRRVLRDQIGAFSQIEDGRKPDIRKKQRRKVR